MITIDKNLLLSLSNPDILIDTVEEALGFMEDGEYYMPNRNHYDYRGNTVLIMPCFIKDYFVTKLVSVYPRNKKLNRPSIYGTVLLNDGETGKPLAMIDGGLLTALRTGAVGGVGVKYLSPPKSRSLSIIGAGVQGIQQAIFACSQRDIKTIRVYDKDPSNCANLKERLMERNEQIEVILAKSSREALENSEIVITSTNSSEPVLPEELDLLINKTYIGIGSFKPDMQEIPEKLIENADRIFTDTSFAAEESGDLFIPLKRGLIKKEKVETISSLLKGRVSIDNSALGTFFFKSVGMALFDLFVAKMLYEKAIQQKTG